MKRDRALIIYDELTELNELGDALKGIELVEYSRFLDDLESYINRFELFLIHAQTAVIKRIIEVLIKSEKSIAFLPKKDQRSLRDSFSLYPALIENLNLAFENEAKKIDLLYGGEEIVLYSAQIGDTPPFSFSTTVYEKRSFSERAKAFFDIFKKLKSLKNSIVTIKTQKEATINTTATGIIIIEHDNKTFASKLIKEYMVPNDAKLSALIISPSSLVGYVSFLIKSLLLKNFSTKLPKDVGLVESAAIEVSGEPPMEVKIDGASVGETPMRFEVVEKALNIILPQSFWESKSGKTATDKETIKLNNLPTSKDAINYQQSHLPLFTHASEESYQALFSSLREEAKPSSSFIILILLSTLLATVGLYLDSSSVIIGAMLLAPLMQPIVSFSMGVLRRDRSLMSSAAKSIAIGVGLALLASSLFSLIMPFETLSSEMQGRLKPTILDLLVALISGVAAAYAKDNPKIMGSLVGVSIAVALVPPIAVSGIGLGWGSFMMFAQAFLLFLTNLAGIIFAAAVTFMIKGFSPIKVAKRGIAFSLIAALLISIPLYISFKSIKENADINSALSNSVFTIHNKKIKVESIKLYHIKDELHLKSDILIHEPLSQEELKELKELIKKRIHNRDFVFEVVQRVML